MSHVKNFCKISKFELLAIFKICSHVLTWDLMWITSMGKHGAATGISECRHSSCSGYSFFFFSFYFANTISPLLGSVNPSISLQLLEIVVSISGAITLTWNIPPLMSAIKASLLKGGCRLGHQELFLLEIKLSGSRSYLIGDHYSNFLETLFHSQLQQGKFAIEFQLYTVFLFSHHCPSSSEVTMKD